MSPCSTLGSPDRKVKDTRPVCEDPKRREAEEKHVQLTQNSEAATPEVHSRHGGRLK